MIALCTHFDLSKSKKKADELLLMLKDALAALIAWQSLRNLRESKTQISEAVEHEQDHHFEDSKNLRSCITSVNKIWPKLKALLRPNDPLLGTIENFLTTSLCTATTFLDAWSKAIQVDIKKPVVALQDALREVAGGGDNGKTWFECLSAEDQSSAVNFATLLRVATIHNYPVKERRIQKSKLEEVSNLCCFFNQILYPFN